MPSELQVTLDGFRIGLTDRCPDCLEYNNTPFILSCIPPISFPARCIWRYEFDPLICDGYIALDAILTDQGAGFYKMFVEMYGVGHGWTWNNGDSVEGPIDCVNFNETLIGGFHSGFGSTETCATSNNLTMSAAVVAI